MLHPTLARFFACLLFGSLILPLFSQTITYQNPASFFVCQAAPFSVTVQNTTGSPLTNIAVAVNFTSSSGANCGIEYVANSVAGAGELDVSDPGAPVFQLADLSPGGSQTFQFQASAACPAAVCIDNAEFFVNEISLTSSGGSSSVTSNPYLVERPLLVITAVNSAVMKGSKGDVLQRKITLRNTRPGALENFIFRDSYQPGIVVSTSQGQDQSPGAGVLEILLGVADFASVGDGDGLFELNESIVITEQILVTDCGVDLTSSVSNLAAEWSCGSEVCQQAIINAIVLIEKNPTTPTLLFEPITSIPECFCGERPHRQGLKITNVGTGAANDLTVLIGMGPSQPSAGVDTLSVVADSLGISIPFQRSFSFANLPPAPCVAPGAVAGSMFVTLTKLSPGATTTIFWDQYFCAPACQQPAVSWAYNYSYFKDCPPNPFVPFLQYPIYVYQQGIPLLAGLSADPLPMQDDSTVTATYTVSYDSLTLLDDELTVEITLPCGMIWDDDNELILAGQAPTGITITTADTFVTVFATYQLPLPVNLAEMTFDFLFDCESLCFEQPCKDSLQTTCLAADTCGIAGEPVLPLGVTTTLLKCGDFPPGCNIQICGGISPTYECPADSLCIAAPPGYLRYVFESERHNFGLPDNDNDRFPDPSGSLNPALVRNDRATAGDTLRAFIGGDVVVDVAGATLTTGTLEVIFAAQHLDPPNANKLLSEQGILPAGNTLRIFDKSQNAWFTCQNLSPTLIDNAQHTFRYDVSPAVLTGCGLPANFAYDHGDSLVFEAFYRIEYNIVRHVDQDPLLGWMYVSPSALLSDGGSEEPIDCGCPTQKFEVTGYEYAILPGILALPPCTNSTFVGGSLLKLELHEGNFFPYEFRNLITPLDWQFGVPPNVVPVQTKLTGLTLQGGASLFSNQNLSPVFANGVWSVSLLPFQNPPLDEGFSFFFQYIFDAECSIAGAYPMKLTSLLDFAPGLPEAVDPLALTFNSNALRALIPNLEIASPLFDLISFSDQLQFDFTLTNLKTVVASQMSGAAPNTWLYVVSPTGKVVDFELINLQTGQPVPQVNGVYQLGNFPVDSVSFRLTGTNNSCSPEALEIHYGWHCTPFTSQIQTPCYEQIQPITLLSPPGEIDMFVTSPSGCTDLCDTLPHHQIQFFNAELGAVYEVFVQAILPPGLAILPGTSQVEYPSGSGNWVTVGEPFFLNNSLAQWNLSTLVAAISGGLPGVASAPANSLTLRFLSEPGCDFIANSFVLFVGAADLNCGTLANTVAKPAQPICIEGVTQPFSTSLNVQAEPGFGCNDEVSFEVSLTNSAALPPGACAIVTLPLGVSFVPGSCDSDCQPNFNCTPTISGNTLTWQLPAGTPQNQVICFTFNTIGWDNLGCENGVVLFRAAAETQALCAATGQFCSAKISTGSLIFPYEPQRPAFDLSNFKVTATQLGGDDLVSFSIDVANAGATNEPPVVIDFYLDTDGNGSGDQLVHSANLTDVVSSGETENLVGSLVIPGGNLCNFVAYIDPDKQCACAGDSAYVTFPIEYQTQQAPTVCSGEPVQIGVADVQGFDYQWTPATCLSCEDCPTAIFNCENETGAPQTFQFNLSQTNGVCQINNHLEFTLQPVPGVLFFDSPLCLGESANLAATEGVSYNWQGAGIVVPNLQIQTVTPLATTDYFVTVTDAFGCTGNDTATVVVHPLPVANAGADLTFCPGGAAQLNAVFDENYDYLWSPASISGAPALSNPALHNPLILSQQNQVYTLLVTDETNGCTATDAVQITFGSTLEVAAPPDLTICLGTSTTLQASGATSYVWSPNAGECNDPPTCSSLTVSPNMTTTFIVTGDDGMGCTDSDTVTVNVTTGLILTTGEPVEICQGESVFLFEEVVSQPGVYCSDTLAAVGNCDSLHCIELIVNPLIDTAFSEQVICEGDTVVFEGEVLSEAGTFCQTYLAASGCDSILCLSLDVQPSPQVELILADTTDLGTLVNLSILPTEFDSIFWSGGNLAGLCDGLPNCLDSLTEAGSFTYTVIVEDELGCRSTASKSTVSSFVCDPEKAQVPNIFTPNGDGVNDTFSVVSPAGEVVVSMEIWSRWGQKIYEGTAPWDGRQDGKDTPSDVFVYIIRVGCPAEVGAEESVLVGDVTLAR